MSHKHNSVLCKPHYDGTYLFTANVEKDASLPVERIKIAARLKLDDVILCFGDELKDYDWSRAATFCMAPCITKWGVLWAYLDDVDPLKKL